MRRREYSCNGHDWVIIKSSDGYGWKYNVLKKLEITDGSEILDWRKGFYRLREARDFIAKYHPIFDNIGGLQIEIIDAQP